MAQDNDSPALTFQSQHYPKSWEGYVPSKVRVVRRVTADFPMNLYEQDLVCEPGVEYPCWVNSHGAISAILPNGKRLGLRPGEFEITAWHGQDEDGQE